MRHTMLALLFAATGCAHLADHLTHVGTAVGLGLTSATIAVMGHPIGGSPIVSSAPAPAPVVVEGAPVTAEVTVAAEAPVYQTWIVARAACANGREYHVRCVRSQGQACFYESDDGVAWDCVDAECKSAPPEVAAWCASPTN
jgi:hypothetical protein